MICFPPVTRAVTPSEGWHVGCMSPAGPALDRKAAQVPDDSIRYRPTQTGTLPLALRTGTPKA